MNPALRNSINASNSRNLVSSGVALGTDVGSWTIFAGTTLTSVDLATEGITLSGLPDGVTQAFKMVQGATGGLFYATQVRSVSNTNKHFWSFYILKKTGWSGGGRIDSQTGGFGSGTRDDYVNDNTTINAWRRTSNSQIAHSSDLVGTIQTDPNAWTITEGDTYYFTACQFEEGSALTDWVSP